MWLGRCFSCLPRAHPLLDAQHQLGCCLPSAIRLNGTEYQPERLGLHLRRPGCCHDGESGVLGRPVARAFGGRHSGCRAPAMRATAGRHSYSSHSHSRESYELRQQQKKRPLALLLFAVATAVAWHMRLLAVAGGGVAHAHAHKTACSTVKAMASQMRHMVLRQDLKGLTSKSAWHPVQGGNAAAVQPPPAPPPQHYNVAPSAAQVEPRYLSTETPGSACRSSCQERKGRESGR